LRPGNEAARLSARGDAGLRHAGDCSVERTFQPWRALARHRERCGASHVYGTIHLVEARLADDQTLEEQVGTEDFERPLAQLAPIGLPREFVNSASS
jgi:hypothetical protein